MLNFSKIKVIFIYLLFIFLSFFSFSNLQKEYKFFDKKVNLGLDLQGGSYLLLEIDSNPLIEQRIQSKVIPIKKLLKDNNIKYNNFLVKSKTIEFNINKNDFSNLKALFFKKEKNPLNSFISKYNSFELDLQNDNNQIKIFFSKYGILTINNSALNQSIEIVRRRIDDLGTKEPTILQRGDKRILVEWCVKNKLSWEIEHDIFICKKIIKNG